MQINKKSFKKICIVNNVLISVILVFNLVLYLTAKTQSKFIIFNIFLFVFLLGMSVYITITKNDFFLGMLYIIVSVLCTFLGDIGNLSGIVFVLFALMIYKTVTSMYITISMLSIAIIANCLFSGHNIIYGLNTIVMYIGMYLIFYFLTNTNNNQGGNKK